MSEALPAQVRSGDLFDALKSGRVVAVFGETDLPANKVRCAGGMFLLSRPWSPNELAALDRIIAKLSNKDEI